jgi:glycerate kinase
VVAGVGRLAMQCGVPCVVLAGRVEVGRREAAAAGIETAYDMVGVAGEQAARSRPAEVLTALATRVAKQWSVRP